MKKQFKPHHKTIVPPKYIKSNFRRLLDYFSDKDEGGLHISKLKQLLSMNLSDEDFVQTLVQYRNRNVVYSLDPYFYLQYNSCLYQSEVNI